MAGVVAYIKGQSPPPQELTWFFIFRAHGVMPRAGGLEDQPPFYLDSMLLAGSVYDAFTAMNKGEKMDSGTQTIIGEAWKAYRELHE